MIWCSRFTKPVTYVIMNTTVAILKKGVGYRILIMKLLNKKEHLITENVEIYNLVYIQGQFNQRTKVNEWKIPTPNPRRIISDLNYKPTYTTDWMSNLAVDNSRHKLDLIIFVNPPSKKANCWTTLTASSHLLFMFGLFSSSTAEM